MLPNGLISTRFSSISWYYYCGEKGRNGNKQNLGPLRVPVLVEERHTDKILSVVQW